MKPPNSVRHLIIYDHLRDELNLIATSFLAGKPPHQHVLSIIEYEPSLAHHLGSATSVPLVMLVVHGHPPNEQFILRHDPVPDGNNHTFFPPTWGDNLPTGVGIFAFGCVSALCYNQYRFASSVQGYLGYREEFHFYIPNKGVPSWMRDFLAALGRHFFLADQVDTALYERIYQEYINTITYLNRSERTRPEDRLHAILLEEQREALTLI